jgi:hypothetical protein
MTDPALRLGRFQDPGAALGAACHFLARREPFASFRADALVRTLDGQVRRGHYLAALDGRRVVGWLGWALLSEAAAQRFAERGEVPDAATLGTTGGVAWLLTAASDSTAVLRAMTREARRAQPGLRIMGVRHGPGGPRIHRLG